MQFLIFFFILNEFFHLFSKKAFKAKNLLVFTSYILFLYRRGRNKLAERITNFGLDSIREINYKEKQIFQFKNINNYLHFSFIFFGLFFGWAGWKFWQYRRFTNQKIYSFLFNCFRILFLFRPFMDNPWQ